MSTPDSPGANPYAGPATGRAIEATIKVDIDLDDASLTALLIDMDHKTVLPSLTPMIAHVEQIGFSAPDGPPVCQSFENSLQACESTETRSYRKGDQIKVMFALDFTDLISKDVGEISLMLGMNGVPPGKG